MKRPCQQSASPETEARAVRPAGRGRRVAYRLARRQIRLQPLTPAFNRRAARSALVEAAGGEKGVVLPLAEMEHQVVVAYVVRPFSQVPDADGTDRIEADGAGAPAHQQRIDHIDAAAARVDGDCLPAREDEPCQTDDHQEQTEQKARESVFFHAVKAAEAHREHESHYEAADRRPQLQTRPAMSHPRSHPHPLTLSRC